MSLYEQYLTNYGARFFFLYMEHTVKTAELFIAALHCSVSVITDKYSSVIAA